MNVNDERKWILLKSIEGNFMNSYANTVCIFMSTYNGEKYLTEQIDSILNQENVRVYLCIRDDGSSDNTVNIIKKYMCENSNIFLEEGENIGFQYSFANISRQNINADYFAFSDQDDVWKLDRLSRAIKFIEGKNKCALYGSNMYIADSNLKNIHSLYTECQTRQISNAMKKYGIFGENMYACTMVWNKKMQDVLCRYSPKAKVSQDVWTQLIAEIVDASIVYDNKETITHRLHESNTAGIAKDRISRIQKGIKIYLRSGISTKNEMVREAQNAYVSLQKVDDSEKYKTRQLVCNYSQNLASKLKLLNSGFLKEKEFERKIFILLLILGNKY